MITKHRNCPICNDNNGKHFKLVDGYNVLRCHKCEFVYVDIENKIVDDANIYPSDTLYQYYKTEPRASIAYYDNFIKRIEKSYPNQKLRILDFGCGSGMFLRRARKAGHDVFGLDYSPYSEEAKKKFNLNIDSRPIDDTDYELNFFDVIISHATYEHLINPIDISNKLIKHLKPNGLFIVSGVPNFNTITVKLFKNFTNNGLGHVNHFEKKSLQKLFDSVNLKTYSITSYGINIWFIKHILNKMSKKNTSTKQGFIDLKNDDSLIRFMNDYDNIKPTIYLRLLSLIYRKSVLFGFGQSLEGWAIKEK